MIFQHRNKIAGRVLEPCYCLRPSPITVSYTFFVRLQLAIIVLEFHTCRGKLVHRCFDVLHLEVQDGESGRSMVRLGIDKYYIAP